MFLRISSRHRIKELDWLKSLDSVKQDELNSLPLHAKVFPTTALCIRTNFARPATSCRSSFRVPLLKAVGKRRAKLFSASKLLHAQNTLYVSFLSTRDSFRSWEFN
jgi:hypothetical protein